MKEVSNLSVVRRDFTKLHLNIRGMGIRTIVGGSFSLPILRTTTVGILVHSEMLKFEQVTSALERTFVDAAHAMSHASHPTSGLK